MRGQSCALLRQRGHTGGDQELSRVRIREAACDLGRVRLRKDVSGRKSCENGMLFVYIFQMIALFLNKCIMFSKN